MVFSLSFPHSAALSRTASFVLPFFFISLYFLCLLSFFLPSPSTSPLVSFSVSFVPLANATATRVRVRFIAPPSANTEVVAAIIGSRVAAGGRRCASASAAAALATARAWLAARQRPLVTLPSRGLGEVVGGPGSLVDTYMAYSVKPPYYLPVHARGCGGRQPSGRGAGDTCCEGTLRW